MPFALQAQSTNAYFTSTPALTPDGKTVIFSYEGDLWKADLNSPVAARLTAMQGDEVNPRVSPDGQWIAFSSNQYGNNDVYVMPIGGGDIKQLTYHDGSDEVDSWSWDSKSIYFTSSRYNSFSEYKVGKDGGTPVRLFGNYFNTIHGVVEHPKTGELFFNDTWESYRFAQRKRYKGSYNPDIMSYNPKTKAYKQYTDWNGKDFYTTIDRNGNVYFASDEANQEYNLYTFINGKKTQLTKFPSSIRRPNVSADGSKVVFEKDYQLWVYDVASKKADKVNLVIFRNNVLPKEQEFDIAGRIESADVSVDGKKMAVVSRGELFVSDADGKFMQQIQRGNTERATEVKWLPDNRTLIYAQTLGGYTNWYTIAADGTGTPKQLTKDKGSNRLLAVNSKHTMGVYLSGRNEVRTIDLKTLASKTIAHDELWGFQNSAPGFSPNDEYVIFTSHRNFEQDIFICKLSTGKITNITKTGISETEPVWSPDGKYIYFASSRTQPDYPYGGRDPHIYRIPLQKYDPDYKLTKFNDLFTEPKKDEPKKDEPAKPADDKKSKEKDKSKDKDKAAAKPDEKKPSTLPAPKPPSDIVIDSADILRRIEQISPSFGTQRSIAVIQKGDKTFVYFCSNQAEGRPQLYRTTIEPFENNKTEPVAGAAFFGYDLIQSGDKYYLAANGGVYKLNLDQNRVDPVTLGYKFNRNLSGEFNQMFDEAWAGLDENYYDSNFHGANWAKVHDQYQAFLPYVNSRGDLRVLLNDMLGELNSSHQGFNSFGQEERVYLRYRTMETGVIYDNDDPYKVASVLKESVADRKGIDIVTGDRLVAVNGVTVDPKQDRNFYFTKPSIDPEMTLTFERAGKKVNVKIHPQGNLKDGLYNEWIERNKNEVTEKSKNRIAYVHMKDMSGGSLEQFKLDMVNDAYNKDALILDLRYNTGGNVHDGVLQFLSQRPYLQWQYRDGKKTSQPNFGPAAKPIILLINEQTLSDGEMTTAGFKALKLGKVIGTETYRWIIFTSAKGLVDGSSYRVPAWGCFTLDGQDLEMSGVAPDITVKTSFVDRLNDNDPQLQKAISEIMSQLK
ncbi:S41 family peptidase [Mucilaginibacter myungsuensis]